MTNLIRIPMRKNVQPYIAHKWVYQTIGSDDVLWKNCGDYAMAISDVVPQGCDYKKYDPQVVNGQVLSFTLDAEATYCDKKTHKRRSVTNRSDDHYAACVEWLRSRAEKNGFSLNTVYRAEPSSFQIKREKGDLTVHQCKFEGILTVTDSECFKKALLSGIGRSKAWGCGLLLCQKTHS